MISTSRKLSGSLVRIAVFSVLFSVICAGTARAAETREQIPVEITEVKIAWVGPESSVSPREKGERDFWSGGRPPTSGDYNSRDRMQEGAFSGNWGKIDVEFTSYREWEDQITFNFYLLVQGKDGYTVLTGSTTAIFVARGKKHYVVMYAYPNAIARFGGEPKAMAVEAVVNGKVVSVMKDPKTKDDWWNNKDYQRAQDVMVDWMHTPMKRTGAEAYELVKVKK